MNSDRRIKRKKRIKVALIIIGVLVLVLCIGGKIGWSMLEKEHVEAANLPLNNIDFNKLEDGVYIAIYEGGIYKWRANKVQVTIKNGKIQQIELISTADSALELSKIEELYQRVIDEQSLQVDTISGATLTSKGYLQGVENALKKAYNE